MADVFDFYVKDNRTIQFNLTEPIMLEDSHVSDWVFHIPRVINNIDMSGWAWWLVYINARGQKYSELLELSEDPESPLEKCIATYSVDYGISIKAGTVRFSLETINTDTGGEILNEWHTQTYQTKVQDTLQGNQVEYAETESDIISALIIEVQNKVAQLVGGATPEPKSLIADMTDTKKVYLYVGEESGESTNYWYYYNGSAWVAGGLYASGITVDPVPTQGSTNTVQSGGVYSALDGIQAEIPTVDAVPTHGSSNAVSSGGVYEALAGKADAETGKGLSKNDYSDAEKQKVTDATADLSAMTTATAEDVGKALKAKTVSGGKVTEWEFGEAGGAIADNSITYEKLQKAITTVQQSKVDFWYYNDTKRTDGTSFEIVPDINVPLEFEYPEGTNTYRVYYISDDGTVMAYDGNGGDGYYRMTKDTTNRKYYFVAYKAGKFYIPLTFGNTRYFPENTVVSAVESPYPTSFLKEGWQPEIMDISVKYPRQVYCIKFYNSNGSLQSFKYKTPTYHIPYVGWYKTKQYFSLLDADWNWVKYSTAYYFYNDGSYAYVQGNGIDKDVAPEYVGDGISAFNDMQVISKGDALNINKPIGHAVVCFGDSITQTGYPSKLQEIAKCLALNYGGSGNNSSKIRKVVTGIGSETGQTVFDWSVNPVDTAIIMAGYNDTYQGTVEGDIPSTTIADAGNDWTAYLALFNASHAEQGTTCGNIGFMIEWIQANHPDVRIVLCNYHNNTDAKPTRYSDVDEAVKALSEYYGIKYIDIRRTSGINKKNASSYLTDGLHPNDAGQMAIAKAILRAM